MIIISPAGLRVAACLLLWLHGVLAAGSADLPMAARCTGARFGCCILLQAGQTLVTRGEVTLLVQAS